MPARSIGHHGAWSELSRALEVEREDLLEEVGAGVAFGTQKRRGCRPRRGRVLGLERHASLRHAGEAGEHFLPAAFFGTSSLAHKKPTGLQARYRFRHVE